MAIRRCYVCMCFSTFLQLFISAPCSDKDEGVIISIIITVCCVALSQSLWSLMAKQVLTYTMTAPYTFLSGLILISELLPIPLPVQTNEVLY